MNAPPAPVAVDLAPHLAGLESGELVVSRCGECGVPRFPPGPVCPSCRAVGAVEWFTAEGAGTVWSFAVFHKAYFPPPGPQPPYVVAVVRLAEGIRMISNIVGASPAAIGVGMAVVAVFERGDGAPLVRFRPV